MRLSYSLVLIKACQMFGKKNSEFKDLSFSSGVMIQERGVSCFGSDKCVSNECEEKVSSSIGNFHLKS